MKSFLILAFSLILGAAAFANDSGDVDVKRMSVGQHSPQPVHFISSKNFKPSILYLTAMESAGSKAIYIPDIKNVSARAYKDFQSRFNDVSKSAWFSDESGYYAYFTKDGFSDRAFYNKNGHWQYSLIYRTEDKLPEEVRTVIKSVYFDWTINVVEEIRSTEGMGYFVYLENKSNLRILKVNGDNEMETMVDFVKQ